MYVWRLSGNFAWGCADFGLSPPIIHGALNLALECIGVFMSDTFLVMRSLVLSGCASKSSLFDRFGYQLSQKTYMTKGAG